MKNVLYLILILALATPALANVDITMDTDGVISCATTGGAVVRGLGLYVELPVGTTATITAASVKGDAKLNAPMDYFFTQIGLELPVVVGEGHPFANPIDAGVASLPATEVSLSVGVLDPTENQKGIGSDGDETVVVATLDIDCGSESEVIVTIDQDTSVGGIKQRGGVVGDSLGTVSVSGNTITCGPECWRDCQPCGDFNNSGDITTADALGLLAAWPPKDYEACADFNHSGDITTADALLLLAHWPPKEGCPGECAP